MDEELAFQLHEREASRLLRQPSSKARRRSKKLRSLLHHLKPTRVRAHLLHCLYSYACGRSGPAVVQSQDAQLVCEMWHACMGTRHAPSQHGVVQRFVCTCQQWPYMSTVRCPPSSGVQAAMSIYMQLRMHTTASQASCANQAADGPGVRPAVHNLMHPAFGLCS
jgi:hypothetical protein